MFCFPQHGFGAFHICPPKEGSLEVKDDVWGSVAGLFLDSQSKLLRKGQPQGTMEVGAGL
jgi:hypothetical protein